MKLNEFIVQIRRSVTDTWTAMEQLTKPFTLPRMNDSACVKMNDSACVKWLQEPHEPMELCPCGHTAAVHSFDICSACYFGDKQQHER